jgi:hemerythrin superfamily protein
MLIYELIKEDHDKVKKVLNDLISLSVRDEGRGALIDQIRDELIPHSRAEESVFYNSIRALDAAKNVVMHSYQEHVEIEALLRTLQIKDIIDSDWRKTALRLQEVLEEHMDEEESKIFHVARELFTDDEAMMMGRAFEKMKPLIKDEGFMKTTFDLLVNLVPPRFAPQHKNFNVDLRP